MSIEATPDLDLDIIAPAMVPKQMVALEKDKKSLVTVAASLRQWDFIKTTLLDLRASGVSALLLLRADGANGDEEGCIGVFAFLRDWDQLLLRNILEVGGSKIPAKYLPVLQQEAKTELKWFQEWQTAVSDPRIHRYPGLPWRSFLRKVNAENFEFAQGILKGESTEAERDALVTSFLTSKKKTICVFPKNWGKR